MSAGKLVLSQFKFGFTLIGLFFGHFVFATTESYLDSVKQHLNLTNNSVEKLNCLYTLSYEYGTINPKIGIEYGNACLKLALREKNLAYQLSAYNGIANSWESLSNFDSALYYHKKSHEVALKMDVSTKKGLTLNNLGLCYKELGYYKKALDCYLQSLQILQKDSVYNYRIHFYLGEIYILLENYKEAEYHSRLGIQYLIGTRDEYVAHDMQVNLAKCFLARKEIDSALLLLDEAEIGLKKNTDARSLALCYSTKAHAFFLKKDYNQAISYHKKELQEFEKLNNTNGMLLANLYLANVSAFSSMENKSLASTYLNHFESLIKIAPRNNDVLLEAYKVAAEVYEQIGKEKKALYYYKKFFKLKNAILSLEKNLLLEEVQLKYETEKKEREISDLKQKDAVLTLELKNKEANLNQRNYILIIVLLIIIFSSFLLFNHLKKQREKIKLRHALEIKLTEEKERLRMAKDLHDDLGSGLSKISFLSKRIPKQDANQESDYVEIIGETAENLIVNMRELIWVLTPENITISGLIARMREYSTDYLEDFPIEFSFSVNNSTRDFPITTDSHRHFLMVLKEALNNIVKHAEATQVKIEINLNASFFVLSVSDNGIGISNFDQKGNGLLNMKTRIEAIGGHFELIPLTPTGTCIKLSCAVQHFIRTE